MNNFNAVFVYFFDNQQLCVMYLGLKVLLSASNNKDIEEASHFITR